MLEVKVITAVLATVFTLVAYIPYLYEIFKGRTKPHAYTWLIWSLTVGIASAGIFYGGGGWGALALGIGTVSVFIVFLLSFKYGTRNITRSDTVVLVLALAAIGVWLVLDNPVLAVLMATGIDALGYIPTYRKLWSEPWSESLTAWVLYVLAPVCILISLNEYNVLTVLYTAMTLAANAGLVVFSLLRRQTVPKPTP